MINLKEIQHFRPIEKDKMSVYLGKKTNLPFWTIINLTLLPKWWKGYGWKTVLNLTVLWRSPLLYITYPHPPRHPPLFTTLPNPSFPVASNQPPPPLRFLLSCFFAWMGDRATLYVLFYLMILWIYACQALVP